MVLYAVEFSFGFGGFAFIATEKGINYVRQITRHSATSIQKICDITSRKQAREAADKWAAEHAIIRGENAKINWR